MSSELTGIKFKIIFVSDYKFAIKYDSLFSAYFTTKSRNENNY